jgi:Mrp family chromosome partitioning ATPase
MRRLDAGRLTPSLAEIAAAHQDRIAGLKGYLFQANDGHPVRSLMVTSGLDREGKTTTAVSLAQALTHATSGGTVLVDVNLRAPVLDRAYGFKRVPGLSDVVLRRISLDACLHATETPGIMLLPWGQHRGHGVRVFESPRFAETLSALRESFAHVVLDGASLLSSPDMLLAVPDVDGLVVVAQCERTRADVIQDVKTRAESAGGKILGVVLNKRKYYLPRFIYDSL